MQIKVICTCGTKFAFEVEPLNGRMPVPVSCPACSADATSLANEQISLANGGAQSSSAIPVAKILSVASTPTPPPPAAPIRVSSSSTRAHPPTAIPAATPARPTAPATAAPAAKPRLSISHGAPAAAATPSGGSEIRMCAKHPGQHAAESCYVCGRPICPKCMRVFGYVCSVYCRDKAAANGQKIPVYEGQKSVIARKAERKSRAVIAAWAGVALLLFATWMWYAFAGSKPQVIYAQRLPGSKSSGIIKLMGPNRHLIITSKELTLFDEKKKAELWSVPLTSKPGDAAGSDSDEDEDYYYGSDSVQVMAEEPDLWLLLGDRLVCHDPQTGERKHEVTFKGRLQDSFATDSAITIVSKEWNSGGLDKQYATRVSLPGGDAQTQEIAVPGRKTTAGTRSGNAVITGLTPPVQTVSGPYPDDPSDSLPIKVVDHFDVAAAGPNVVQCDVKVLEIKIDSHEAVKKNDNPLLESSGMSAANSLEAAQELLNDLQRSDNGGKVYEDVSRYRVTLRRSFEPKAEPWTGEVIGEVSFFPLPTVDLLVAGKTLRVFSKDNKMLWESKLTYTIAEAFTREYGEKAAPAVEDDDTLYFFDQGVLTAFDLKSGNVRWRVTSVWISRVMPDGQGNLYVNTTSASPEDIEYSKQIKIFERLESVLMKVDAKNGEVKWKVPRAGDECFISGKYLYGARTTSPITSMFRMGGGSVQFFLYRLNPRNGKIIWRLEQPRIPEHMDFDGKRFLLQFRDEVQVLRYLSLF